MRETFYYARGSVLINFTREYSNTVDELVNSKGFASFLDLYFDYLEYKKHDLLVWINNTFKNTDVKKEIKRLFKMLYVLELDEIDEMSNIDTLKLLSVVETAYKFWRGLQRYSITHVNKEKEFQIHNYLETDNKFNTLVLNFYRTIQEKLQKSKNKVYRQLQAGTNASILTVDNNWDIPSGYEKLRDIDFIGSIMLRTPLILHPKSNKRLGVFERTSVNPMDDFLGSSEDWICFPCYVGELLTFAYFYKDFISSAVACPNLFELASRDSFRHKKPDCIMIFGNPDNKKETTYYYDDKEDIWIGKVSGQDVIEYFGYVKKMMLTLHNLCVMNKGWLPIHGAMVRINLRDGSSKNLMFMGDSGAGKSETIEALTKISEGIIDGMDVIFDDMGSIHFDKDGNIVAKGSEIGAFVRLDDLDTGSAYKDMDRSIFFNPELDNARVVLPASTYNLIVEDHRIDYFMYANNYVDKRGLYRFIDKEEAKNVFIEGKRRALGTTQEKGLSTTFFANPFGPMQEEAIARPLIDLYFDKLFDSNTFVGEIYTCLGLENKGDNGIELAGKALLELIEKR